MPPIRSITFADGKIQFTDSITGQAVSSPAVLPVAVPTVANLENYLNNTWIPANVTDYQMRVHVFSTPPLNLVVGTWNLNEIISDNWWI